MAPSVTGRNGTFSPPLASTASYTNTGQSRLNIVSRLAIEGKAKQSSGGALIKLYLKINIPVDSVSPGQTLPLFAEENVKIRDCRVHPLDSDSVPYNFSSTTNPLLHNAARALNLPARSNKSYLSLFESYTNPASSRSSTSTNGSVVPPLEEKYTGYFLISGYNVCFVLPKEFPAKFKIKNGSTDSEGDGLSSRSMSRTPYRGGRRSSIAERTSIQFMAGLELWVPFLSQPPRAPYMLSIPIPRCLSNTVKVRLPSPTPMATSFASLSSDEDSAGWDLSTEPHVTRNSPKHSSRKNSYTDFADDESSEASVAGPSEGYIVQGTFTSADYVRIRWASPLKVQDFPDHGDGRRRVGVTDVQGNMTCTVLERRADGVKMRLDYQGNCTGVWFPGVATMLGMDVGLDAHGCRLSWPSDSDGQWSVDGDAALTGFTAGQPINPLSRQDSLELPQLTIRSSPESTSRTVTEGKPGGPSRSSSSSSSLLRAPLPHQVSTEFSFDDPLTPTTSGLPSSVPSLTTSMDQSSLAYSAAPESGSRSPSAPITLHLNMNELLPSPKNKLTFNISGTVLVIQDLGILDPQNSSASDLSSLALPQFHVFASESESVPTTVRNQCDGVNVEVLGSVDSLARSKSKKTVVPSGAHAKCGPEGSEIIVKPLVARVSVKLEEQTSPAILQRGLHASPVAISQPALMSAMERPRSMIYRDGPLVIPWVSAEVTPILPESGVTKDWAYAVTLSLPTPVDGPSEWLEFGLAMPFDVPACRMLTLANPPEVDVACASVNGIPVRFETFGQLTPGSTADELAAADAGTGAPAKRKWLSWVRVHIALAGALEVVYLVKGRVGDEVSDRKGKKAMSRSEADVPVFLPMFSMPVSRFEAKLWPSSDFDTESTSSNDFEHFPARKFCKFNAEPFSCFNVTMRDPYLSSMKKPSRARCAVKFALPALATVLPYIISIVLLSHIIRMRMEFRDMKASGLTNGDWRNLPGAAPVLHDTTTVTVTVNPTPTLTSERRWFVDKFTVSYSTPAHTDSPETPPLQASPEPVVEESTHFVDEEPAGDDTFSSEGGSLFPFLYLPLSWPLHYRMEFQYMKEQVIMSWEKVWRVIEIIIHWPLPVDNSA